MNSFEIILLLLASMVLLGYASWYFKSWKTALILTGLSLVGLYLSIWFTSQFLTIDEEFFIGEVIHVNNAPFLEWWFTGRVTEGGLSGSFRTSTALMGLLVSIRLFLLREFLSIEQMMMILKLSHWLIVFVAMLASIHIIMDQMIPEKARRASFLPLVYTALLLPTNAFALRIFNHDGISMSLGVLSVMLIVSALLRGNARSAFASIIVGYLAAQEKMQASPVLILAIAAYGYLNTTKYTSSKRFLRLIGYILVGMAAALAVGLISALVVARLRFWDDLIPLISSISHPLISWTWPIITFTFDISLLRENQIWLLAASALGIFLLAAFMEFVAKRFSLSDKQLTKVIYIGNLGLALGLIIAGLIGVYALRVHLDPIRPMPADAYRSAGYFLGVYRYFDQVRTPGVYILAYTSFLSGVFLKDIPTIFWLLFFGRYVLNFVRKASAVPSFTVELLAASGFVFPLAYGILQVPFTVPVSNRYMGIGMFFFSAAVLINVFRELDFSRSATKAAFSGVVVMLLVVELLDFAPFWGPFRPVWMVFDEQRNTSLLAGDADPVWSGWGETFALVGHEIQKQCLSGQVSRGWEAIWVGVPCENIELYRTFPGDWLGSNGFRDVLNNIDENPFEGTDYHIFTRTSIVLWGIPFPYDAEPVATLSYRGYVYAWIFTGSELQSVGFEYGQY